MTDAPVDLEELKRLLAEGTPGPWAMHAGEYGKHTVKDGNGWSLAALDTLAPNGPRFKAGNDAALIVAAVNSLAALIARVEEREKALKEVAGCFDAADAEGLPSRLYGDGHQFEVGDLHDLVIRRLLPAADAARAILAEDAS